MPAVLKSRVVNALLILFLVLAPRAEVRPADAPLRKRLAPSSQDSEGVALHPPRPFSRREILQAIQNDLAQRGISGKDELRPGDIEIQASPPAIKNDMGLEVKRIGFDPLRREIVFKLWTSHEPQYLPFEVTTRRDPQSLGLGRDLAENPLYAAGGDARVDSLATGVVVTQPRTKPPVLAKPGTLATLIMLGQNMRITTTVVPLQPGSKGQCILVRELTSARIMKAEVVDEGLLQTSL